MKELMYGLDRAYQLISSIPVAGNNVEVMAEAKGLLRGVFAELERRSEPTEGDTDGQNH